MYLTYYKNPYSAFSVDNVLRLTVLFLMKALGRLEFLKALTDEINLMKTNPPLSVGHQCPMWRRGRYIVSLENSLFISIIIVIIQYYI